MIPPFWERVGAWICRHFGHREDHDAYVVWCKRCRLLLRKVP